VGGAGIRAKDISQTKKICEIGAKGGAKGNWFLEKGQGWTERGDERLMCGFD